MYSQIRTTRGFRFAFALLALAVPTAGCDDDPVEPEEEPEVAVMRLTVGSQTINVNAETGAVTGGPIIIATGGSGTTLSATFLRDDGQPDPLVVTADFRLDATPANTAIVTFTRTGSFAGT